MPATVAAVPGPVAFSFDRASWPSINLKWVSALLVVGVIAGLGWTLGVPTVLLSIAVVYCQMHYGVDAIAGLLTGAAVTAVVERLDKAGTLND